MFGMPVNRHSFFDPRRGGYSLKAKTRTSDGWTSKWDTKIPLTGKAMTLAGDVVFVAGAPIWCLIPKISGAPTKADTAAYCGPRRHRDGSKLAEYKLDALPAWDAMAAAYGKLFIVHQDGSLECWGQTSY